MFASTLIACLIDHQNNRYCCCNPQCSFSIIRGADRTCPHERRRGGSSHHWTEAHDEHDDDGSADDGYAGDGHAGQYGDAGHALLVGPNSMMIPRCTLKFEKCAGGMKITCSCDDAVACGMLQNLCMMMQNGLCSCCCMMNGMVVCHCALTMGMTTCEMTKDGCRLTCTSGDAKCFATIQACYCRVPCAAKDLLCDDEQHADLLRLHHVHGPEDRQGQERPGISRVTPNPADPSPRGFPFWPVRGNVPVPRFGAALLGIGTFRPRLTLRPIPGRLNSESPSVSSGVGL